LPAQLWLHVKRYHHRNDQSLSVKDAIHYTSGMARVGAVTIPAMVACMETDSILGASAMMAVLTSSTDIEINQIDAAVPQRPAVEAESTGGNDYWHKRPGSALGAYRAGVYEAMAESDEAQIV
jgi:hypothetical protein